MKIRRKIIDLFLYIFKIKPNERYPKILRIFIVMLYPSLIFYKNKDFYYDIESNTVTIFNIKISLEFFYDLSSEKEIAFKVIGKNKNSDGSITPIVQTISQPLK